MEKKDILLKGIGMHLGTYAVIAALLLVLGVPGYVVFTVMGVLLWGLFVLSYAFYNKA